MENLKPIVELFTFVSIFITIALTLRELRQTKKIHSDTLDWNRMYETQNILKELNESYVHMDFTFTKQPIDKPYLMKEILQVVEDRVLVGIIDKRLNQYESIARGIKLGLYDETLVKLSRRSNFVRKYFNYSNYINHYKELNGNTRMYQNFEWLAKKWLAEIKAEENKNHSDS